MEKFSDNKGFSLIELMVAMFIFGLVMVAMVAVSVAGFRSYGKSKAIKNVTEDVGFAINSIAKDVRMGKIVSDDVTGDPSDSLMIIRNSDQTKVCYIITRGSSGYYLGVSRSSLAASTTTCPIYSDTDYKNIVDLSGTGMTFDATSGFRNQKTDIDASNPNRGWAEINLNIVNPSMDTDSISVQTVVSSRDYGWEKVLP